MLDTTGPHQVTADTSPNKPQSTVPTDRSAPPHLPAHTIPPAQAPRTVTALPPPGRAALRASSPLHLGLLPDPLLPDPFAGRLSQTMSLFPAGWSADCSAALTATLPPREPAHTHLSRYSSLCLYPGKRRTAGFYLLSCHLLHTHSEKLMV